VLEKAHNSYSHKIPFVKLTKEYIKKNIRLFVIVAAYNEETMISEVIANLKQLTETVVIVDDGSADNTAEIALAMGCITIKHDKNYGQGAAIRSGVNLAIKEKAEYIATFDADGQHDATDLQNMLIELIEKKQDIILGSRFLGSAPGIPIKRVFLLKMGILFTYIFSGVVLTDVHNGLRVFTAAAAMKIDLSYDRMSHASVIIDSIVSQKLKFLEFPVTITYTKYSKMKGQKLMDIIKIGTHIIVAKTKHKIKSKFANVFKG
jgi:glycosyltransferase involved in cell wall biosynthesis